MAVGLGRPPRNPGSIQVTLEGAIQQLASDFGLSARELAQALGVDRRTLERWASGDTYPRARAKDRLVRLAALHGRLAETFETTDAARAWLHHPMPYLGNMVPADAVRVGRFESVEAALEAIDSGFAS